MHAMTALAGCFLEAGELDAAADAYSIVLARLQVPEYLFAAREALAHIAARRGDEKEFEACARVSDEAGWEEDAGVWTRAQILLFRGLSHESLGRGAEARLWLERARACAESNGVNKVSFDAEAALARLAGDGATDGTVPDDGRPPEEMPAIRRGISAMRKALIPA